MQNRISPHTWNIAIGVLVLAIFPWPIGIYTLVRVLITGIAAYLAYQSFKNEMYYNPSWGWVFIIVALLFNPLFPLVLGRALWIPVDIISGILLLVHKRSFATMENGALEQASRGTGES